MPAAFSVLGPALGTAAEAYLRSVSPAAALEREEIQAQRQLLPLKLQAQQLAIQKAQRQATQEEAEAPLNMELLQAQVDRLRNQAQQQKQGGGLGRDIVRINAGLYLQYNHDTKQWDQVRVDDPVHGYAAVQKALERVTTGQGTPTDLALIEDYHLGKTHFDSRTNQLFNPYGTYPTAPGGSQPPGAGGTVPTMPQSPSSPGGLPRPPALPARPAPNTVIPPASPEMVAQYTDYLGKLGQPAAATLLERAIQEDTQLQTTGMPSMRTQALSEAFTRAFAGQGAVTSLAPGAGAVAVGSRPTQPVPGGPVQLPKTQEQQDREAAEARKGAGVPNYTQAQVTKAVQLFPFLGNPPRMSLLTPQQMTTVNKAVEADKEQTGFHKILRQAGPLLAEQASMDSSANYAQRAEALIAPETVGLRGYVNRLRQQALQQLPVSERTKQQWFDSRIPELEVVAHAIGYIHANAMKRIGGTGGTGGRGVTQFDIKEVTSWFNPFDMRTSAAELRAKLKELQGLIQRVRPQVDSELRVLGVDPQTHGPLKGRTYGDAETATPDANQILNEATE